MRRLVILLVVALAACGNESVVDTTEGPAPTSTTATTRPTSTTATTLASAPAFTLEDCATPPVTFALLCDVYDIVAAHHVESPLDPEALAAGAALGAESYEGAADGEAPESFICAVPHSAFETLCPSIAERLRAGHSDIEAIVEESVSTMVSFSLDPFSLYLPPELSGALSEDGIVNAVGVLLTIEDSAGSRCSVAAVPCRVEVVLAVLEGPAFEAGLRPGDVVTAIDGHPVEGLNLVEIAALLDGPEGSEVSVEAVGEGDEASTEFVVERRPPPVPTLVAEMPRDDIGYLRIPDFGADIPAFVHETLLDWTTNGVDDLVLDMRDNPGGFVDVATLIASEFLADGLVLRSQAPAEVLEYPVQEGGVATAGPDLTVVVNGGSASASEILAAVLQERSRASVVGQPTFGKDTVQIGFPLRNDGELRVTVARWLTPEGDTVAGRGVTPDVLVEVPPDASPGEVVDLVLG